jgi:tetratricopeptide (TPR) repeat protein
MVLRLEPNNAVALNSRGNVLRDMKDYEAAVESYSRAIELRPDYAEALINRGYTIGRWQQ